MTLLRFKTRRRAAVSVAAGSDGVTRLLWASNQNQAALWLLNAGSVLQSSQIFGPYPGWTATDVTVGSDNQTRIELQWPLDLFRKPGRIAVTDREIEDALENMTRYEIATARRAAQFGDDVSAFQLGMAYETGYDVPQSCSKAADWPSFRVLAIPIPIARISRAWPFGKQRASI